MVNNYIIFIIYATKIINFYILVKFFMLINAKINVKICKFFMGRLLRLFAVVNIFLHLIFEHTSPMGIFYNLHSK